MAARQALLASMRRIRRRRRVAATINGGTASIAWAAPVLATVVVLSQRFSTTAVSGRAAGVLLLATGAMGAAAAARRRISLLTCARIVDREWSADTGGVAVARVTATRTGTSVTGTTDDCVLAAVALAEEGGAGTSFVEALTADALGRTRQVPPAKVVPPPPAATVVAAVAGVALLATVILWCPGNRRWTSTGIRPTAARLNGGGAKTVAPVPLRFAAEDIATEREESSRATAAGQAAGDTELTRLGSELARLSADTSTASGAPTAQTMARLQRLFDEAHAAAQFAAAATAAATAAARTLSAATNVGDAAVGLAEAAATGLPGSDGAGAAAAAAERLLARGDAGQTALQRAAASAAAALAGASAGAATATNPQAGGGDANHEDEPGRRLDPARDGEGRGDDGQQDAGSTVVDERRHLQRLRRDLQTAAAGCAGDPVQCRRNAGAAGRSLADLHRQARTAPARQRLAEAAQQLLDRVRRGGAPSAADSEAMDRFARAAHGKGSGHATTRGFSEGTTRSASARVGVGVGGGAEANTEAEPEASAGAVRDHLTAPGQEPLFETGDAEPNATSGPGSTPVAARSGGSSRLDTEVASARSSSGGSAAGRTGTGAGISADAAGRALGSSPTTGGSLAARDAHVHVADADGGPSRAEIIGAAGARGFASAEYRRVFDDYHSAVEESLDATVVPPGRRSSVRRYFQLIRPRTMP